MGVCEWENAYVYGREDRIFLYVEKNVDICVRERESVCGWERVYGGISMCECVCVCVRVFEKECVRKIDRQIDKLIDRHR